MNEYFILCMLIPSLVCAYLHIANLLEKQLINTCIINHFFYAIYSNILKKKGFFYALKIKVQRSLDNELVIHKAMCLFICFSHLANVY